MTRPALIFAAGFGTRMAPLTDQMPKPLIKVAGRALLDHALDLTVGAGPVIVNTHYLADQIHDHLQGTHVIIQAEDPILDTGGGLKRATQTIGLAPCFTLNSDAVWVGDNPLTALDAAWSVNCSALLLLAHIDQVAGRVAPGDFDMDAQGRLTRGGPWVYLGAEIIDPAWAFDRVEDVFSLNLIWDDMIAAGRLFGTPYGGRWCDVGRPENIAAAEAMLVKTDV